MQRVKKALRLWGWLLSKGHSKVVELLKSSGAEELGRGYEKMALMEAASKNGLEQVQLLLDRENDVNTKSEDGKTVLMFASEKGHSNVVTLLLEKGAEVNAKANDWQNGIDTRFGKGPFERCDATSGKGS